MNWYLASSRPPYPPGPRPKPFIGNVLDFPLVNAAERYADWGKQYNSGILHLEALGNHIIILNSVEDADELLEKRAENYSDRPVMPMVKLMGWDFTMILMPHNDEWRLHRRITHQNFRQAEAPKYYPIQTQKVHELLRNLSEKPEESDDHNKLLSISFPLSAMYGYNARSLDDPFIKIADKIATTAASVLHPGGNFVDIFPILGKVPAWVPGATSVRTAALVREWTTEMKRIPMEYLEKQFAEGKVVPSLVTDMLERKFAGTISTKEEEAIHSIAYTTISTTKAFFYFMAKHPNVQRKAQAEIDRVVGNKRLPDFSDRASGDMPYLEAVYRESLRMSTPLHLGIPHAASEADLYKGYFIPKGATVFANIWGMCHDENRYPDPFKFKPERFLDESGKLNGDDRILAYGFLWLMMASVLACFNIDNAKDENGDCIEIDDTFEEIGLVRHKKNFRCSFNVRSSEALHLIQSTNST
ncbi:cytochrome P450 [Agrocybe pediades]|nr:cytochrome P450 [Agrocybe pediades]